MEIEAGLKSHDHSLFIKNGWISDPCITLGPDGLYYLTGTAPQPGDPREQSDPFNVKRWIRREAWKFPQVVSVSTAALADAGTSAH